MLAFHDSKAVEDFVLQLQSLVSQLTVLGVVIGDDEVVAKYLWVVPTKPSMCRSCSSLSTLSIDYVMVRLKVVEDRVEVTMTTIGGKLLLTEEKWAAQGRLLWVV